MSVGNPGPVIQTGLRATPGYEPTPNSEPLGSLTGAPPRTRFYSRPIIPAAVVGVGGNEATQIVDATAANRVAVLLAPDVGFTIFIGPSGVTPATGLALPPGQPYEAILVGLQDLYAVSNAPVWLPLQVQIAPVLLAERERRL